MYLRFDSDSETSTQYSAQSQKEEKSLTKTQPVVADVSPTDHIWGAKNAPIHIIVFSDFDCFYCANYHQTLKGVVEQYNGLVNVVFRHFPIEEIHPQSMLKAQSAECAFEQGGEQGFWRYVDFMFSGESTTFENIGNFLAEESYNQDVFFACVYSGRFATEIESEINQALVAGAQGTPHSVIVSGLQKIPVSGTASEEQLIEIIESLNYGK